MPSNLSRRNFIAASTSACLIGSNLLAAETAKDAGKPWLRKSCKSSMFYGSMSLAEHFAEAKKAGFEGIEMVLPVDNIQEVIAASQETGLVIDGSVGTYHSKYRHTDSDDDAQSEALASLIKGLKQTGEMGGDSMMIVPGHGNDGTEKRTLKRIQEAIESALPLAEANKVAILIENTRNRLFYEHMGGQDQSADALAEFIDRFDSPWVGVQFDIANICLYGDPAKWIRTLGSRIKKVDVKGFSRSRKSFTKIGGGDIDWPSVVEALQEINYSGWVAADFGRSHISRLIEISKNMETHLHCSQSLASAE